MAGIGQLHGAGGAQEECGGELLLEPPDLIADGGRRDPSSSAARVKLRCRAAASKVFKPPRLGRRRAMAYLQVNLTNLSRNSRLREPCRITITKGKAVSLPVYLKEPLMADIVPLRPGF